MTVCFFCILHYQIACLFALGSGIVMDWEQTSGSLYTSGDVRFVRIWDVQTELRVQVRQCM